MTCYSLPSAARRGIVAGIAGAFLAAIATVPLSAAWANTNASHARKLIENLTQQAITILKSDSGDIGSRERKFRTVLTEYFAMQSISKRVAGKHWQTMTPQQRQEFQSLFGEWVLKTYSRRFGGYKGEAIAVEKASAVGRDTVLVRTRLTGQERSNKVDWRVIEESAGRQKIVDVSVDGVSMLVTQKSEVSAIVKNKGVDGLLATLRKHTQ